VGDRIAVPATSLAVAGGSIHPARSPQRHQPVSGYPATIAAADDRGEPCADVIELNTDQTPQLSMTNELAKALHRFATHSSAGAGRLADRQDRADFRKAVLDR
jgi:hypothetical protein